MKPYKKPKRCFDCEHASFHYGSQTWLTCKFQSGWRDINAVCNLDELM